MVRPGSQGSVCWCREQLVTRLDKSVLYRDEPVIYVGIMVTHIIDYNRTCWNYLHKDVCPCILSISVVLKSVKMISAAIFMHGV